MSSQLRYADKTLLELPSLSLRSADDDPHNDRIQRVDDGIAEATESLTRATEEAVRIGEYAVDPETDPDPSEILALLSTIADTQSHLQQARHYTRRLRDQDEGRGSTGYPSVEDELEAAQESLSGGRQGYPPIEEPMDAARSDIAGVRQYLQEHRERHQATAEARRELKEQLNGGVWMQRLRSTWGSLFLIALVVEVLALIAASVGIEAGATVRQTITNPLFIGLGVVLAGIVVRWLAIRAQHALQD